MAKNKLKSFHQNDNFEHVFQPLFKEIFQNDFFLKGNWAKEYFKNNNPIVLELGCGKGEYTTGLAKLNPDINYIGIDIKGARICSGAKAVISNNLKNVAFIRSAIEPIQSFFAENEISEIWLTFSDPQPNKPKKRLSSSLFLNRYLAFLKSGAIIHLKTDSRLLFEYTFSIANENKFSINKVSNDVYSDEKIAAEVKNIQTFYEKKFINGGKKINYLEFVVNEKITIVEPADYDKFKAANFI